MIWTAEGFLCAADGRLGPSMSASNSPSPSPEHLDAVWVALVGQAFMRDRDRADDERPAQQRSWPRCWKGPLSVFAYLIGPARAPSAISSTPSAWSWSLASGNAIIERILCAGPVCASRVSQPKRCWPYQRIGGRVVCVRSTLKVKSRQRDRA